MFWIIFFCIFLLRLFIHTLFSILFDVLKWAHFITCRLPCKNWQKFIIKPTCVSWMVCNFLVNKQSKIYNLNFTLSWNYLPIVCSAIKELWSYHMRLAHMTRRVAACFSACFPKSCMDDLMKKYNFSLFHVTNGLPKDIVHSLTQSQVNSLAHLLQETDIPRLKWCLCHV